MTCFAEVLHLLELNVDISDPHMYATNMHGDVLLLSNHMCISGGSYYLEVHSSCLMK